MPAVKSDTQRRVRDAAGDGTILSLLVVVGWVYTFGLELFLDISLYDETYYLLNGLDLLNAGLPPADGYPRGAPLYAVWYWLLSLFRKDPVLLYYFNFKATVVLPSLACFLFMRCSRVARTPSVLVSLFLLFVNANFDVWTRISHFALSLILFGLALASFVKSREMKMSIYSMTALLTSYVRPEFFLCFLCLLIFWAGLLCWRLWRLKIKPLLVPLLATVVVSGVLLVGIGVPLGSSERSWLAFEQHYAYSASQRAPSGANPWTDHRRFVEPDFPRARTIWGAFYENPRAFCKHVVSNLVRIPRSADILFLEPYLISVSTTKALKIAFLICTALALLSITPAGFSRLRTEIRIRSGESILSTSVVLLFLLTPVVSSLVIYPRFHYILFFLILPVHAIAVLCSSSQNTHRDTLTAIMVCMLVIFITKPADYRVLPQPNLAVINTLRSLAIQRPVNLLEVDGGYGVYAGNNYRSVPAYSKYSSFNTFLRDNAINMIVVSDGLKADSRFRDDPEWQTFIADPSSRGFRLIPVLGSPGRTVIVKDDLYTLSNRTLPQNPKLSHDTVILGGTIK